MVDSHHSGVSGKGWIPGASEEWEPVIETKKLALTEYYSESTSSPVPRSESTMALGFFFDAKTILDLYGDLRCQLHHGCHTTSSRVQGIISARRWIQEEGAALDSGRQRVNERLNPSLALLSSRLLNVEGAGDSMPKLGQK